MKLDKIMLFRVVIIFLMAFLVGFWCYRFVFAKIEVDNTKIKFKDDLKVEVYSRVKVSDVLLSIEGNLVEDKVINTSSLGVRNLSFLYEDLEGKRRLGTLEVEVVDTTSPTIFLYGTYTLTLGDDKDLAMSIMSVDNYDNKPMREIIGTYDVDKVGDYNLTYTVTDNSNNSTSKNFVLKVIEPDEVSNSSKKYMDFEDIYTEYKTDKTEIGIDVSKWQGEIDFQKVKAAGASFVMIRVGSQDGMEGESVADEYFKRNIEEALKNNLKVGIYYYSYAKSEQEAKKQAGWVSEMIKDYEVELPVVFDWENWSTFNKFDMSLYTINKVASTFLEAIEAYGYRSMLYGSKYYLENIWSDGEHLVWLAHYTNETDYQGDYFMWQLSSTGKIDGIDWFVDVDILYS